MFEEKTFENIQAEMLADMSDDINKSEGSIAYNSVAATALQLEGVYEELESVYKNLLVDTQEEDFLIEGGAEQGCPIDSGVAAIFKAQLNCAAEIGTEFQHTEQDFFYSITEEITDETDAANNIYMYKMQCEDTGAEPNGYLGEIEPVEYMEAFESGELISVITPGTDQEDLEVYRLEREEFYQTKACGGNRAYYKQEIDDIAGVGGCRGKRRVEGDSTFPYYIISDSYGVPTSTLVAAVQAAIDPADTSGNGDGIAVIAAKPVIYAVSGLTINIAAKITFDTGYTYDGLKSLIEAAIDAYYVELGKTWEDHTSSLVVRLSQIETRLVAITGIVDVADITFNGSAANITLDEMVIPVRGTFTCS